MQGGGSYEGSKSSIPELTTISPAIFVPIEGDELTAPFTPPANRIRRIEAKITKLDAHRKKIRHNLTALYRQECLRHIQNTQAWEREYPEKARQTLEEAARYKPETQRGIDLMIENMTIGLAGNSEHTRSRQEHQQNQNQNQQQQQQQAGVKPRKDVDWYSRQQLVVNLEGTIGQGLKDLRAYEAHADALRKNYIEICNRERAKDRELDFP
jgi:hypothetical protein